MRSSPFRWLPAAALVLAGAAPAAAMFRPGPEWSKGFKAFNPTGIASLAGGHLFTLNPAGLCRGCASSGATTCQHPDQVTLVHLGRGPAGPDGAPDWKGKWVVTGLPAGYWSVSPGPGNSLVLGSSTGPYLRLRLSAGDAGWNVAEEDLLLDADQRRLLGLPAVGPESLAVTRDGSLVLGFQGGGVALVSPAALAASAGHGVKWLVRPPAPSGRTRRGPSAGPALTPEVAVDSAGQVLVLDPGTGDLARINPASLKRTLVARAGQWPEGFLPLALATHGRQVVAGGVRLGPEPSAGLVALSPTGAAGRYAFAALDVALDPGSPFTFAPEGYLAICSSSEGILRILEPAPEAAAATDPADPAAIRAQAAFDELMAATAGPAGKDRPARSQSRVPGPADRPADCGPGAGAAGPPRRSDPEEDLSLDELCAGLGLQRPPRRIPAAASSGPAKTGPSAPTAPARASQPAGARPATSGWAAVTAPGKPGWPPGGARAGASDPFPPLGTSSARKPVLAGASPGPGAAGTGATPAGPAAPEAARLPALTAGGSPACTWAGRIGWKTRGPDDESRPARPSAVPGSALPPARPFGSAQGAPLQRIGATAPAMAAPAVPGQGSGPLSARTAAPMVKAASRRGVEPAPVPAAPAQGAATRPQAGAARARPVAAAAQPVAAAAQPVAAAARPGATQPGIAAVPEPPFRETGAGPGPAEEPPEAEPGDGAELADSAGPRREPPRIPEVETLVTALERACQDRPAQSSQARIPVPPGAKAHLAGGLAAFAEDGGVEAWVQDWADWLREQTPHDRTGDLEPGRPAAPRMATAEGPARFALPPAAIARAVAWMFRNANRANHRWELEDWRAAGGIAPPRFAFGLYLEPRRLQYTLELGDLNEWADWIDADLGGDGRLAAALDRSGGRVGSNRRSDGRIEPAYGLAVTLGPGSCELGGIRPAGAVYRLPFRQPRFPEERKTSPVAAPARPEAADEPFGLRPMPPLPERFR